MIQEIYPLQNNREEDQQLHQESDSTSNDEEEKKNELRLIDEASIESPGNHEENPETSADRPDKCFFVQGIQTE
jgi:hypothetical protein